MAYTKREPDFVKIQRVIRGYGLNAPAIAEMIDVSAPTARKRLEHPELFSLSDLKRISQRGHIPWEELHAAFHW